MLPTATDGTGYFADAPEDDALRASVDDAGIIGSRMGSVTDVADAVELFIENLSRWVSGQQLLVSEASPG